MNRLRIAASLAGLALFLLACGSNAVPPPDDDAPPRKQAAQSEELLGESPEAAKSAEPPYPPKAEKPLEQPSSPPPVNLEDQPTLLAEDPPNLQRGLSGQDGRRQNISS